MAATAPERTELLTCAGVSPTAGAAFRMALK